MLISHNLPLKTTFLNTQLITQYHCTCNLGFYRSMLCKERYCIFGEHLTFSDPIRSHHFIIYITLPFVHSLPGSPHPAHMTSSQSPPSLSSPITPSAFHSRLKTICSSNPFLHSFSGSTWSAFTDHGRWTGLTGHWCLLVFVSSFIFCVFGYVYRVSESVITGRISHGQSHPANT